MSQQRRLQSNALPGAMLVFIILWALSAVLMLASTLGSASRIDEKVVSIRNDITPIDSELDTVSTLVTVSKSASDIREAAAPLTGGLAKVVTDVGSIDASAKTILTSATEINGKVKTINASANEINGAVHTITSALSSIEGSANSINGTVHEIDGTFVAVNGLVQVIQDNLVGISRQVDVLTGQVKQLKSDTGTISPIVDQINANAQAIRNSPVVLDSRNAAVMHQTIMASTLEPPGTAGVPAIGSLLGQLQGLGGPLPDVSLNEPLPLLGISLQDLALLGDVGNLLSLGS